MPPVSDHIDPIGRGSAIAAKRQRYVPRFLQRGFLAESDTTDEGADRT
jgi:hypothetical protein